MASGATLDNIKDLREKTGAGVMNCKRALDEANGDVAKAEEILKELGLASAAQKAHRETREGLVESYIHAGGRLGALVEVSCETDFVARTDEMKVLAHDLAMQVAAMPSTTYVDKEAIADDDDRPPEEVSLLEQPFIKDPSKVVRDVVQETIAKVGENIRIRRFARFALGE